MPALRERSWEAEGNHRNVTSKLPLSYLAFTGLGRLSQLKQACVLLEIHFKNQEFLRTQHCQSGNQFYLLDSPLKLGSPCTVTTPLLSCEAIYERPLGNPALAQELVQDTAAANLRNQSYSYSL